MTKTMVAFASMMVLLVPRAAGADRAARMNLGEDPATPQTGPILPCGACVYTVSTHYLSGELSPTFQYRYPLTLMRLQLLDSANNVLDTIHISPTTAHGGQNMAQSVNTTVTTGVIRVRFFFRTGDGLNLSQYLTVQ